MPRIKRCRGWRNFVRVGSLRTTPRYTRPGTRRRIPVAVLVRWMPSRIGGESRVHQGPFSIRGRVPPSFQAAGIDFGAQAAEALDIGVGGS